MVLTTHETLVTDLDDGVFTITLNRPESLNTIVPPMPEEFAAAIGEATRDDDVRVVVVREVVVREVEGDFASGKEVVVRDRVGGLVGVGVALTYLPRARTLNLAPRAVLVGEVEEGSQP